MNDNGDDFCDRVWYLEQPCSYHHDIEWWWWLWFSKMCDDDKLTFDWSMSSEILSSGEGVDWWHRREFGADHHHCLESCRRSGTYSLNRNREGVDTLNTLGGYTLYIGYMGVMISWQKHTRPLLSITGTGTRRQLKRKNILNTDFWEAITWGKNFLNKKVFI